MIVSMIDYSRRLLLQKILVWSGLAALLAACAKSGSDDNSTGSSGDCSANGAAMSIGGNHGHTGSSVSAADVTTGTQKTYNVNAGSAGHSHTVTVTASGFSQLLANTAVTITTDADATGHSHSITVSCS